MSRLISRQEAAGLLDCTTQTVTNWVNKGVIKGHVVGNNLMIDRDSIEQYFDSLKDLANMERSIADMKAEIQEIAKDLRATLDEARGCHLTSQTARNIFRNNQLTLISISKENLTEREQRILSEMIKGVSLEEIANVYGDAKVYPGFDDPVIDHADSTKFHYDFATNEITNDERVTVYGKSFTTDGTDFKFEMNTNKATYKGAPHATYYPQTK